MSKSLKFWLGFSITVLLGSISGGLTTYFIDPGVMRALTSFVIGAMIGIIGYELTSSWAGK